MFDTIFAGVTVVTLDSENNVLRDAYVGVTQGKIMYVGAEKPTEEAKETITGTRRVLMPGLINSHTHVPMTAMRGISDDENLQDWLQNYIFPTESKWDGRCVNIAAQLGFMDMISSGTVSVTDMYMLCDALAEAAAESGIKANLSNGVVCFSPDFDWGSHKDAVETRSLVERWHLHDGGRIRVDASIHAEYTSHEAVWRACVGYAREKNLGMHVHLSETEREHLECLQKYGKTPAAVLNEAGLFDVRCTAAHCVWISDEDMDILAQKGVTAVHNPVSNLKLSSGVARVTEMQRRGVSVSLGTDSVASNNSHDMFEEIKLAAIGQKNASRNPKAMPGSTALLMATRNGAKAQGREGESGCVAVGYDADLIMLDFDKPHLWPCLDVISQLTYAARGSDVCLTMVKGKTLYRDGEFLTLDKERVYHELTSRVLPKLGLTSAI